MAESTKYPGVVKVPLVCMCLAIFLGMLSGAAWSFETVELSLTKFNTPGTVRLEGAKAFYTVKVPIPERWDVQEMTLNLSYINSTAVLAKRSQIMVVINGYPIAQTALLPESPEGLMTVQVPVEQLKFGYNELTLLVAQHFTDKSCAPDDIPEVWTVLDLLKSSLSLSYELLEVPLSLNSVTSFLFDPRSFVDNRVHLVLENRSEGMVKLAALAASGVALRFDYRPVQFSLGDSLEQGMDNIVIGSGSFLESLFTGLGMQPPQGDMTILPLPDGGGGGLELETASATGGAGDETGEDSAVSPGAEYGLLVLTGESPDRLEQTVQAFSLLSFPLSNTPQMNVDGVTLPEIDRFSGKSRLAPKKNYLFKELGFSTTTFQGYMPGNRTLSFSIPTGLLMMENKALTLSLTMAYAANMREDSTLVVRFNGEYISSIPLSNTSGGWYRGYSVSIPLTYARPGWNTLEFTAALVPLRSGNCEVKETEHLALTLFGDSEITMPPIPFWAELPNLELLLEDGFPLAEYPDFRETVLALADDSVETAAAGVNFVAMLSQKNGVIPSSLTVTGKMKVQKDVQLLVVGPEEAIPAEIMTASGMMKEITLPVHGRLAGSKKSSDWLDQLKKKYLPPDRETEVILPDLAVLDASSVIGSERLLLAEFESPFSKMRSTLLVTADTGQDLYQGVLALWDSSRHPEIKGDLALIDFHEDPLKIAWTKVARPYYDGDTGSDNWIDYLANSYPRMFFLAIAVALLLCAVFIMILLGIYRRKRLRPKE